MNLGVISTIFASFFSGSASAIQKKIALGYRDNRQALIFQYGAVAFFVITLGAIRALWQGTRYFPSLSTNGLLAVIGVGVVGYIGIALLYKALDTMSAGIALVIANTCTFMMYFLNLWLYPGEEAFSLGKIIITILFFGVLVAFLLDQDKTHKTESTHKNTTMPKCFNNAIFYPIGTAICRSIYFTANSYFVKTDMMSPVQSTMMTETTIFVVAVLWFLIRSYNHRRTNSTDRTLPKQHIQRPTKTYLILFLVIGLFATLNAYLTYYGYQMISANMVNVIKLFTVPVTAFAAWIFLKDALTKKQTILLVISMVMMIGFVLT